MRFWDPLLAKRDFCFRTYILAIWHPKFLVFGVLSLLFFFATDPSGSRQYISVWLSALLWPIVYLVYISLYTLQVALVSVLTGVFSRLRVPTSLISLLSVAPTVYLDEYVILGCFSDCAYPQKTIAMYSFYYLSVQVAEALFFTFVFPELKRELNAGVVTADQADNVNAGPQSVPEKFVIIDGERIRLNDIQTIEARQHHVHVTFSGSQKKLRARMGDIVAQTAPSDGIQTHRSWWVARHVAEQLDTSPEGKPTLKVRGDLHVPVARTRIDEVTSWAEEHLRDVSPTEKAAE